MTLLLILTTYPYVLHGILIQKNPKVLSHFFDLKLYGRVNMIDRNWSHKPGTFQLRPELKRFLNLRVN